MQGNFLQFFYIVQSERKRYRKTVPLRAKTRADKKSRERVTEIDSQKVVSQEEHRAWAGPWEMGAALPCVSVSLWGPVRINP